MMGSKAKDESQRPFLKRIFGREKSPPPDRAATAPLDPHTLADRLAVEGQAHVSVGAAHSIGAERDRDDDALLVLTGKADGYDGLVDFGLLCVADGLGGYKHGNIASSIAVRSVARSLTQAVFLRMFELDPSEEDEPLEELILQAFREANQAVLERSDGGATTLTLAMLLGEQLMFGHIGDTRAYFIQSEGTPEILTEDHSLVKHLVKTGVITEEEATESPHQNVLLNALGKTENIQPDVFTRPVQRDGYLLICSDGLWGEIPDDEIKRIIVNAEDPQKACDMLVHEANRAGGSDNITVVLIYFPTVADEMY